MANPSAINSFNFNFKDILIDEIALEGLEGTGLDLLWRRLESRILSEVPIKMKIRFWNYIVDCETISFYQLPEPVPRFELRDRFTNICEETGQLQEPPEYLDGPYEYFPIKTDYGSCINYNTRKLISREKLKLLSYEDVVATYGDTLVMVASIEERWKALAPHKPITYLSQMTSAHYCILELVGRGRENGQMTVGKSNLVKVTKDPKMLFYNRNFLESLDLLKVQSIYQILPSINRNVKCLLVRLNRFYAPKMMNLPKVGKLMDVIHYLNEQPDQKDLTENMLKNGIIKQGDAKRLGKWTYFNIEKASVKSIKDNRTVSKRVLSLNSVSDESSQSDEEGASEPVQCRYKIKRNLMRQAFEVIVESGVKGVTMQEMARTLGIKFRMTRMIFTQFKKKKILREFFVDKGKSKVIRYVAISATTDEKYEEEKNKLIKLLKEDKNKSQAEESPSTSAVIATDVDTEVPTKKVKLNCDPVENMIEQEENIEPGITEVELLEGFEKYSNKNIFEKRVTLRKLKFANGILKVLKQHQVIFGFTNLNLLVSKEINEPPMYTKTIKASVQSLSSSGQVKVYQIKWPVVSKQYDFIICDARVPASDPRIKARYKEICLKAIKNNDIKELPFNKDAEARPLTLFTYKRYTKLQKLHEFLMNLVYFNVEETYHSDMPRGYSSLVDIIPEITIEFAIRITSRGELVKIMETRIPSSMFQSKLKDVPPHMFRLFVRKSILQTACIAALRLLAMCGLVQMIEEERDQKNLKHPFYVNKRATLINTSGSWPREVDKETLTQHYEFKSMQDVHRYWRDAYTISLNTAVQVEPSKRFQKTIQKHITKREEVEVNDNGQILGNGEGPCGFDGSFYSDMPRLWSNPSLTLGITSKIPTRLRSGLKRNIKVKRLVKKPETVKPYKSGTEKVSIKSKAKKKISKLNWSPQEDHIIMMCKAALTIMSPMAQSGGFTLRNLVAKDIMSVVMEPKWVNYIHKRAMCLESNVNLTHEQDCLVNEIKFRRHIFRKYENLFTKAKARNRGNLAKTIEACRLPMLELVYMMQKIYSSDNFNQKVPCVAVSIEDFYNKFTICPSNVNRTINTYKTPPESGPFLAALKESVVLCLLAIKATVSSRIAKKMYSVFKSYKEADLQTGIDELRKGGAVVFRDKKTYATTDSVESCYKISEKYHRKWLSRLNIEFTANLVAILENEIPQTGLKGSAELNCVLLELQASDALDIYIETVPSISCASGSFIQEDQLTVADIFANYHLKSGTLGWRNKTNYRNFTEMFKLDYKNVLVDLMRNAVLETSEAETNEDERIINHLKGCKENGSTFNELQTITGFDAETLKNKLVGLESTNTIKRVGYFKNILVMTEFAKPWTVLINGQQVLPVPWLTLDLKINYEVFLKWAGRLMDKVFRHPSCTIAYLSDDCEIISTRAVQEICMFLEKNGCVTLSCLETPEPSLFSDDDVVSELTDFNPYGAVENIIVSPVKDSLTRFSYLSYKISFDAQKEQDILSAGGSKALTTDTDCAVWE